MSLSRWLAGIFSICAALSAAQITETPKKLPVVKSGEMPFYPPLASAARVQGDVHLRVRTDGSDVASVVVEGGQPMLAKAAVENVRTWRFDPHEPTSFSTLFSYRLLAEPNCKTDKSGNGQVRLNLPTQIEINASPRGACYDPNDELDLSEPLRVFLTGCEVDGSPTPCEKLKIRLHSGSLVVTPARFKEPKGEGFVVPKEFRTLNDFAVSVETGNGSFTLANEDIRFLKGKWKLGIDHAPFKGDSPIYNAPVDLRCAGFVVFEWGEPGVTASAPCK